MKHIGLKIIAFLVGIGFWFYVVSARDSVIEIDAPLVYLRLPETMAIASRPPATLRIKIKGKAIDLIRLKSADKNAATLVIDLHDVELGSHHFAIGQENFRAPNFPEVHYVTPERIPSIDMDFDTRIKRTVPVRLHNAFEVNPKFTLIGTPRPDPDTITIAGARKALTRIFEVYTQEERFQDLEGDQELNIPLDLQNLPSYVYPSDSVVKVRLQIQPLQRTSFQGIPVQLIGNFDHKMYSLLPATATVEVTGGKGVLSQIRQNDIQLFVEFNRFAIEDADSLEPTVRIIHPIQSFQVHPEKFYLKSEVPQGVPADSANPAKTVSIPVAEAKK
jgi:YbbR domain-containing protein